MIRVLAVAVVVVAGCGKPHAAEFSSPPDRLKTYVAGDPSAALDRMRRNAIARECTVEERTSGTLITCAGTELWVVPDPKGMEVICRGRHDRCTRLANELARDEAEATTDTGAEGD